MQARYCFAILSIIYITAMQETETVQEGNSTLDDATALQPLAETVFVEDSKRHVWSSQDFPKPYPFLNQSLTIQVAYGYFISITIETLDLNGQNGDFLLIKEGDSSKSEGKGKVFTYFLKSPKKYLLYSNVAFLDFQAYSTNNNRTGFRVYYERVGEESTTSEIPTTAVYWPTPSGSESIYYTVYVSGRNHEEFRNASVLGDFTTALVAMASEYCAANKITLAEEITEKNVRIYYLIQCPSSWPGADTCVKVRFALPVVLAESSLGYQLTESRLEEMWTEYASKHLSKYSMDVYGEPDSSSTLRMWTIINCTVLVVFVILLYFVRLLSRHLLAASKRKRRFSDTTNIISESRPSDISLAPHPYQSTPSFFDNDYSFDQYEPDIGISKKEYNSPLGKRNEFSYPLSDDSDDDIVYSTFSNSNVDSRNKETNI